MERVISQEMRAAIERNRSALNGLFDYHRSVHREPDHDDIMDLFYRMASPLYGKGIYPHDDILCGIFSNVLTLAGKGYIGNSGRYREVENLFFRMLESFPYLLGTDKNFAVVLFNALFNIYQKSGKAMNEWCEKMIASGVDMDYETFRRTGFVLAWRYGMSRFREEAAEAAGSLDDEAVRRILDLDKSTDTREFVSKIKCDPWFKLPAAGADREPVFAAADGFSGYGGHFRQIPSVFAADDILFATDGNGVFRIYADIFGVELVYEPGIESGTGKTSQPGIVYGKTCEIIINGKSYPLPDYCRGDVWSVAAAGNTVAWTMSNSYRIYIAGSGSNA